MLFFLLNFVFAEYSQPLVGIYEIKMPPGQTLLISNAAKYQTAFWVGPQKHELILAKPYRAISIRSAQKIAAEMSNPPPKVEHLVGPQGAIFAIQENEKVHVFSTRGGRLLFSKNEQSKDLLKKLRLVKK